MKKIVIGLGFGDEGKGLVADWLASKNRQAQVVRYCGGHQAGHCVRVDGEKHIFSNFGSGTIRGLPTLWQAKTCDPVGIYNEYQDLAEWDPVIYIDPKCPITTPFEKLKNVKQESINKHGSIGVGFGATIAREESNYHLYFQDLLYPELFRAKFNEISKWYFKKGIFITGEQQDLFFKCCEFASSLASTPVKTGITEVCYIYESSQGIMLDMDYGVFPNVTRSRVGAQEITLNSHDEIYLVTRAYQTRHGNGWCSEHGFAPVNHDETNKTNDFQGEFRTRVLDLDLINYAMTVDQDIKSHKRKNLVITCLDQMEQYPLTHKGIRRDFKTEGEFVDFIISNTPPVQTVYLSHGPTANDISVLK